MTHWFELYPEEEYRCGGCHSVWIQYGGDQALRVAGDILEYQDSDAAGWYSCCEGTRRFRWERPAASAGANSDRV